MGSKGAVRERGRRVYVPLVRSERAVRRSGLRILECKSDHGHGAKGWKGGVSLIEFDIEKEGWM